MSENTSLQETSRAQVIRDLIVNNDISKLSAAQKVEFIKGLCEHAGLDPIARPFEIIKLQGKEVVYCTRSGASQLSKRDKLSSEIKSREYIGDIGIYEVTVKVWGKDGRSTEATGSVSTVYPELRGKYGGGVEKHPKAGQTLSPDDFTNARMKAETKALRRATLNHTGMGMVSQEEVEDLGYAAEVKEPSSRPERPVTLPVTDDKELQKAKEAYLEVYKEGLDWIDKDDKREIEINGKMKPYNFLHPDAWKRKAKTVEDYKGAQEFLQQIVDGLIDESVDEEAENTKK